MIMHLVNETLLQSIQKLREDSKTSIQAEQLQIQDLLQNALQIHKQSSCTWGVKLDSNLFKCFVKIPKQAFEVEQLQLQA